MNRWELDAFLGYANETTHNQKVNKIATEVYNLAISGYEHWEEQLDSYYDLTSDETEQIREFIKGELD